MEQRQSIARELQEAGNTLPAHLHLPLYAVPEGYFEAFAATVLARIRSQEAADELGSLAPLLAGLSRRMPYAVPEGYFGAAAASESGFLASLPRTQPYTLPAAYFEEFAGAMLEKVAPKAKVVSMRRFRVARLAVAASVAALLAVGAWIYRSGQQDVLYPVATNPSGWVEKRLQHVPDQALEEFLEHTATVPANSVASRQSERPEVRRLLNDVSDNEVEAFLEQVPSDDDMLAHME